MRPPTPRRWVPIGILASALLFGGAVIWHIQPHPDRGLRAAGTPWTREDIRPGLIHLHLRGEGYGLGFAEGSAMKAEIRETARFLREDLLGGTPKAYAQRVLLMAGARQLDAFMAPRFREELRGMADATELPYAELLLINTFDDLKHLMGCSSAVVLGKGPAPLLHGRNLDYPIPKLAEIKVIRDIETRGTRIRSFGFPAHIGVLTGMSSRGLGLSSHTSASRRQQAGEPAALLYRRLLEDCASLEEMQAVLAAAPRTMGNNLALSDGPHNRALALEFDAGATADRTPERGRLFVTNHFWTPGIREQQDAIWWKSGSGSQARVACLARSLPPDAKPSPALLQAAFRQESSGRAWRTPANQGTVQSIIMAPIDGQAWIATGQGIPVTRGAYHHLAAAW